MDRKTEKAYNAIREVAGKEGVTVDCVVRDMELAIREAWLRAKRNDDRAALSAWAEIPCEGALPTALELVAYLGERVRDQGLS